MAKITNVRHRVPSLQKPKRDHDAEAAQNVVDTMEGKNNPAPRKLPPLDLKQTMQALIIATAKDPCYICEGKPHCVEMYRVPNGLNLLGQKMIFYTLCFDCKADVTSPAKVEYKLVRQLKAENAVVN